MDAGYYADVAERMHDRHLRRAWPGPRPENEEARRWGDTSNRAGGFQVMRAGEHRPAGRDAQNRLRILGQRECAA